MEKFCNVLAWCLGCLGLALLIVGALATPALADGCDCSACNTTPPDMPPACCMTDCPGGGGGGECECSLCTGDNPPACCDTANCGSGYCVMGSTRCDRGPCAAAAGVGCHNQDINCHFKGMCDACLCEPVPPVGTPTACVCAY